MAYLKALGILRILAEQADSDVRGAWREGCFVLRTKLDRQGVLMHFHKSWQPSAVFSPWNGDGGFLVESGTSGQLVARLRATAVPKLSRLREAAESVAATGALTEFSEARKEVKRLEKTKKENKKTFSSIEQQQLKVAKDRVGRLKNEILFANRSTLPNQIVDWLDACLVLEEQAFRASPILGSGGVDGRMEFSVNFLANLFALTDAPERSLPLLESSLFNVPAHLEESSIGQFAPGSVGGPNATQGLEGKSIINPWDYLLMTEGVLVFSGSAAKRLNTQELGRATFPFTLSASSGTEVLTEKETSTARGELWLPIWDRFLSATEVRSLFREARMEWKGKPSRTGLDASRAIASLGVDRGIVAFQRYGLLQRNGKAFLATPLFSVPVDQRPYIDLLRELDPWLDSYRRNAGEKTPARFRAAVRRIEAVIFEYCRYGEGAARFQGILRACGQAERELAVTSGKIGQSNFPVRPLSRLSAEWIDACDDRSDEFLIATALASIYTGAKIGALRSNLEPVFDHLASRSKGGWMERDRTVIWSGTNLARNLAAILERRLVDAEHHGEEKSPLRSARVAPLEAILGFLQGDLDEPKIADLLWGLTAVEIPHQGRRLTTNRTNPVCSALDLQTSFRLLKLLYLSGPLKLSGLDILIPVEPTVLPLLRAGRLGEACTVAMRRLRAAGLRPLPHRRTGGADRDSEWAEIEYAAIDPLRVAAALLIPISSRDASRLAETITRQIEPQVDPV